MFLNLACPASISFSSYLRGKPSTNYDIWLNKVVVVVVEYSKHRWSVELCQVKRSSKFRCRG